MKKLKSDPPKTMLTITVGFLIVYLITQLQWTLIVAVAIGLIGVLSTWLSEKVECLWMKLAWVLSLIIPNILLGLIYFIVLFPVAVLARIFGGKDILFLKNNKDSVFWKVDKTFDKASFEKLW